MKKLCSIMVALVMLISLAACGGSASPNTEAEQSSSAVTNETSTASNGTGEDVVEEAGTNPVNEADPVTYSIFIDHSWFWLDRWGVDPVSQEITKRTGVSFDVTRATDGQQLALLIAADDLPDFVYTSSNEIKTLLSDPNVCYSYNELVERTGVDIHATESEIRNNTANDGNYYSLLNANITQEAVDSGKVILSGGTASIAYRTDIYEAIGSPEIKTLEDLENALIAAKELYPNIIPLLNDGYLNYFEFQLGVTGGGNVGYNSDNQPCYRLNTTGVKEYYALLNRFARKGLISAEAQTYNYDRFADVRNSGGSFMQLRTTDEAISSNNAAIQSGSGYTWKLLTNDLSENALVHVNTGIGWSGTYITKKCTDPERAIEFMSWCRSEEGRQLCSWGIQGEHWDYDENGQTVTTEQYRAAVAEGKQKQDDFGIAVWIFGDQGDEMSFIDHAATSPDLIDYTARLQNGVKQTKVMSELYFAIPTDGDELTIYNALNDMVNSESLKVIFAESDEEYQTALDSMYKQAQQLGIEKLEEWMRNSVASRMN